MKREEVTHQIVFTDMEFARKYYKGHRQMSEKFGSEYAQKLKDRGFKDGKILDAGCGFGSTNLTLAGAFPGAELVGIDLSEPLLEIARSLSEEEGYSNPAQPGRVRFEKADVKAIPYQADSFDAVINANMVHLVEDPLKMLDEIERVLKPGGCLFIADLRRSWLGLIEREIKAALTLEEARILFAQSSLRPAEFSSSLLWWRYEV